MLANRLRRILSANSLAAWQGRLTSETLALLAILGLGVLFRLAALGGWSLWLDELATWSLSRPPAPAIWTAVSEPQPPLYYLFLHYWSMLGRSEFWLRLPSALTGALAVLYMWKSGAALGQRRVGLLAAALLALSPLHIWYSREVRMYGPAAFWGVVSVYYYVQVLRHNDWRDTFGLAAATLLGIYTAYSMFAVWALQVWAFFPAWQWWSRGARRTLVSWLGAQALIGLGFAPYWPLFRQQTQFGAFPGFRLMTFLSSLGLTITFEQFMRAAALAAGIGAVALLAASIWVARSEPPRLQGTRWAGAGAWGLAAVFVALTILGAIPAGLSLRRQLLVLWPVAVLAAAAGLVHLRRRWVFIGSLAVSGVLAVTMLAGPPYEDWRAAVGLIARRAQPLDVVLMHPTYITLAFDYYAPASLAYAGTTRAGLEKAAYAPGTRIWFVLSGHAQFTDPAGEVPAWFEHNANLASAYPFERLAVYEYLVQ